MGDNAGPKLRRIISIHHFKVRQVIIYTKTYSISNILYWESCSFNNPNKIGFKTILNDCIIIRNSIDIRLFIIYD